MLVNFSSHSAAGKQSTNGALIKFHQILRFYCFNFPSPVLNYKRITNQSLVSWTDFDISHINWLNLDAFVKGNNVLIL